MEEQLKIARKIHLALAENEAPIDDFLIKNEALIKSMLGYASLYPGPVGDMWSRHLDAVHKTMKAIQEIHDAHMGPTGDGNKPLFYKKRDVYFYRLENQLRGIGRFATGLQKDMSIKDRLEISTKSYENKGYIKGYSDKLDRVARASNLMSKGTYLGMGLSAVGTGLTIRNACALGREGQCAKVSVVETSKLVTGQGLSLAAGSYLGGTAGGAICVAIGVPTGGVGSIICVVALSAGGAWLADKAGSWGAGFAAEALYEVIVE
ncbi:hypothetical protein [Pseudomonas sp. NPDC007930]|uniref:hypothetical protein n=1 Tax=Pseudomonas sp. NPDC007930 TaxID=3364417 RepID=UPI0036F06694